MRYRRGRPEGRTAATCVNSRCHDRCSWLVKACHYTRMGCDEISQRAVQGSLYRGAGRQRRSERLKVGPYECPDWGYFCGLRPATSELRLFHESVAAVRHIRRGRPKGVPLRAEGFSKRRCQFESVAAKPHLSPRKAKRGCRIKTASLHHQLNPIFLKEFFTKTSISNRFGYIIMTILFQ